MLTYTSPIVYNTLEVLLFEMAKPNLARVHDHQPNEAALRARHPILTDPPFPIGPCFQSLHVTVGSKVHLANSLDALVS